LNEILDSIDQGEFAESLPLVEEALQRLDIYNQMKYIPTVNDVSDRIRIVSKSGFFYDSTNKRMTQQVIVENIGNTTMNGPISLVLENLSSGVSLHLKDGDTYYFAPRNGPYNPYVNINIGSDNVLRPGERGKVLVEFDVPRLQYIQYQTRIIGGIGDR
jgi:hypothetical protein